MTKSSPTLVLPAEEEESVENRSVNVDYPHGYEVCAVVELVIKVSRRTSKCYISKKNFLRRFQS